MLLLSSDADIVWEPTWERRYVLVRLGSDRGSPVLIGIDEGPGRLEQAERALDIFDGADRVEAVATTPVRLAPKTGRSLSNLLTRFDWNGGSLGACPFEPEITFRFVKGDRSAQVQASFRCGEMALDGVEGPAGGGKMLSESERRELLRAARTAFAGKFDRMRQ